jgi:diacylglycerol kinase family enzyme
MWATEVRIANGRFHGGVELIEKADVESGEIIVQAVRGRSLFRLGYNYASKLFRRASGAEVREFHGRELVISTRPPMRVSIDGELGPETPFTASVAKAAVTIAAPREEKADKAKPAPARSPVARLR